MQETFKKFNIDLSEQELSKFKQFLDIFKEKNSQINLSSIRDDEWIIEKHFIDSIMLNIFLEFNPPLIPPSNQGGKEQIKVADLWTGGGFPLIPLAIINPDVNFTWIDSVWKKLKAIDDFIKDLDLKNVSTLNWRAEDIWQNLNYREKFDFVVSRATAYFPTLLEYAIPMLKIGWIFIAYKLDNKEELKEWKKALIRLWAKIMKVKNYRLADQDRTLVFVEKLEKTHLKYPRIIWEPSQNPIK